MRWIIAIIVSMLSCTALAGEVAYTVRATALKAKPYTDAATLATLEQRSRVVVVARQSSWTQVKANGTTGWVRMLSLQFSNAGKHRKTGDSGLRALFNVASGGGSGGSVTTGVRGLSEEDLKNAHPNPQALETVQGYAVARVEAQKFATSGSLLAQDMGYVAAAESGGQK